ncbi:MAG: NlpC/P60 family protein [Deltaproteobacteria bacterium]|nr:NlpC/P60 family protein [Deltaproteobacteria bacterium]
MANRLILGSALCLALLLFPQMALSTTPKSAVKKSTASGKAPGKSKCGGIIKKSANSRSKRKLQASSSPLSPSYRAAAEDHPNTLLKRVIPQRNGHFIVEPYKSRKRPHFTGPAAKLTCAEVVPGSLIRQRTPELPNFRELILMRAKNYQGTPYALGASLGTGPATDCSGFVQYIYKGFHIDLPRTSAEQAQVGKIVTHRLDFSKMLPGDLLFFRRGGRSVGHAGIYLGEGKMIHASSQSRGVIVTDLRQPYYQGSFVVAKRVFEMHYPEW